MPQCRPMKVGELLARLSTEDRSSIENMLRTIAGWGSAIDAWLKTLDPKVVEFLRAMAKAQAAAKEQAAAKAQAGGGALPASTADAVPRWWEPDVAHVYVRPDPNAEIRDEVAGEMAAMRDLALSLGDRVSELEERLRQATTANHDVLPPKKGDSEPN
jgi:hypothetical protein